MLRAVRKHVTCKWARLYIERWLTAPMEQDDGTRTARTRGTPQGGVSAGGRQPRCAQEDCEMSVAVLDRTLNLDARDLDVANVAQASPSMRGFTPPVTRDDERDIAEIGVV